MFQYARDFNQDIGNWDVSNVVRMDDMFWATNTFNRDIGRWNVARVTDMRWMFDSAIAFNQDISGWRGPAAENAQGSMFKAATAFQARFTCTDAVKGPASSCRLK
jgi:surface protein